MGRRYCQLDLDERRQIWRLLGDGFSVREVSEKLNRHVSTIYRELQQNRFVGGDPVCKFERYYPVTAHQAAAERRARQAKLVRYPSLRKAVVKHLKGHWSPEQIAGRMKLEGRRQRVSHETIYRFVYGSVGREEELYRYLETGRKKRRRRYVRKPRGFSIAEENLIANRPLTIRERSDFGHWEADLMIFRLEHGKANVTSLIERKSRYLFVAKNQSRHSEPIFNRIGEKLGLLPPSLRRTLTIDRGTEFAAYQTLKDEFGTHSYFCDPAAPQQKGAVENTNRRLRRFLPRSTDVAARPEQAFDKIVTQFNRTPRKCLGYQTPEEVLRDAIAEAVNGSWAKLDASHFD